MLLFVASSDILGKPRKADSINEGKAAEKRENHRVREARSAAYLSQDRSIAEIISYSATGSKKDTNKKRLRYEIWNDDCIAFYKEYELSFKLPTKNTVEEVRPFGIASFQEVSKLAEIIS